MLLLSYDDLKDKLSYAGLDRKLVWVTCANNYTTYPTAEKNYINDCIRDIHQSLTYADKPSDKAVIEIGSYINEGVLMAMLRHNHLVITRELSNQSVNFIRNNSMYGLLDNDRSKVLYTDLKIPEVVDVR